jgi:hypothetical protein
MSYERGAYRVGIFYLYASIQKFIFSPYKKDKVESLMFLEYNCLPSVLLNIIYIYLSYTYEFLL